MILNHILNEMNSKERLQSYQELDEMIHKFECFSVRDLNIHHELEKEILSLEEKARKTIDENLEHIENQDDVWFSLENEWDLNVHTDTLIGTRIAIYPVVNGQTDGSIWHQIKR